MQGVWSGLSLLGTTYSYASAKDYDQGRVYLGEMDIVPREE